MAYQVPEFGPAQTHLTCADIAVSGLWVSGSRVVVVRERGLDDVGADKE